MKSLLILFAVIALAQFATSQTIPDTDNEILQCVMEGVRAVEDERQEMRDWVVNTFQTVERLIYQRRRCLEITNDRLQQACMATWAATALLEGNRLRNDLARLTDEETADWFFYHFLSCFGVDPDDMPTAPPY